MKFKFFQEFKEFAVKGNMIDIAIGVIIGTAFNKVVDVMVKEVFLPPLSFLTDGINMPDKRLVLREAVVENGEQTIQEIAIGYGKLIEAGVDFFIISLTVFVMVKFMNSLKKKSEDPQDQAVVTPKNIELLDKMSGLMEKQVELLQDLNSKKGN